MFSTIYIVSFVLAIIAFMWDEIRCSGEIFLFQAMAYVIVCAIPVVNTILLIWFIFDEFYTRRGDILLYRRKGK